MHDVGRKNLARGRRQRQEGSDGSARRTAIGRWPCFGRVGVGGTEDWRPDWRKEIEAKVEHARQGPNSTECALKTNEWVHRGELNGPRLAGEGRGRKANGAGFGKRGMVKIGLGAMERWRFAHGRATAVWPA